MEKSGVSLATRKTLRLFSIVSTQIGSLFGMKNSKLVLPSTACPGLEERPDFYPEEMVSLLLLQLVLILVIWNFFGAFGTIILFPFSFFSVLFHELGHALMAILTGGRLISIQIGLMADNGLTVFAGGAKCLILPAGYLFSTFAGSLVLFYSFSQALGSAIIMGCLVSLLFVAIFAQDLITAIFSLGAFILLLLVFKLRQKKIITFWVMFSGLASCFISICSIMSSLIIYQDPQTDGYRFAKECLLGIPATFVGIAWLGLSLLMPLALITMRIKQYR